MGALTSKPTAFNFRTWELNSFKYTSCQDSLVPLIRVDLFQKKVVRVLPIEDWISDSQRFLFLNLDKQTFQAPALIFQLNRNFLLPKVKKVLRQHTMKIVLGYLVKRILKKREKKLNLNLLFGATFSNSYIPYHLLNNKKINLNFVIKNSLLEFFEKIKIDNFNEIYLININPRLNSPLINLELKEALNNGKIIKSVGNYQSAFPNYSNNLSSLNIDPKSLIIYSESLKDNKWIKTLKNVKMNLSPVYLNFPLDVYNDSKLYNDFESLNFLLCLPENLKKKNHFSVNFNTSVPNLEFDIFIPTTNYFVSSGNILSLTGNHKLKMVRPSYSLSDHISALVLMLNNYSKKKEIQKNPLIFNNVILKKSQKLQNRLSNEVNTKLLLQKLNG